MKIIIDNWLDPHLAEYLNHNYLFERAHWFGHQSVGDDSVIDENRFYNHVLDTAEPINRYLFYKLRKTLMAKKMPVKLLRMYFNVQFKDMDGAFHKDDGYITALYMVSKTREEGDGDFEIKDEGKIRFVQNRLICFDANKKHRGLAPKDGVRIMLAFKTDLER
tara:strand:- start:3 stop:491 length:489 start_codon:yes stop_codon:yes gene_type:complete